MDRRRWGDVRYDDRMRGGGYDDRAPPPPRYDERAPRGPTRYERGPSRYGPPPQYDETDMQPQEGYQPQGMYGGGWWEAQERGDMPPQTYDGGYGGYATEIDRPVPVTWVDQQEATQNAKAPEARPPPQRPTAPPPQERPPQSTSPTEPPPATPAPEVRSEMNQPGADLEEFVRVGRNWVRLINGTATESSPADVVGRVVPVAAAGALRDAATTFEGWQEAAAMAAEKAQAAAEAKAAEEAAAKAAETLAAAEAAVKAAEAAKAKSTATAAPDTTSRRDVLLKQQAKELKPNPGAPQPSSTGRASKQQVIGTQSSVTDAAARMRRRQRGRANPNPPRDVPPPQRIDERIVEGRPPRSASARLDERIIEGPRPRYTPSDFMPSQGPRPDFISSDEAKKLRSWEAQPAGPPSWQAQPSQATKRGVSSQVPPPPEMQAPVQPSQSRDASERMRLRSMGQTPRRDGDLDSWRTFTSEREDRMSRDFRHDSECDYSRGRSFDDERELLSGWSLGSDAARRREMEEEMWRMDERYQQDYPW